MRELITDKENTWCPGCGNFGILSAFKKAVGNLLDDGLPLSRIIITTGIGCHGKIFDYLALSGMYCLHGRGVSTAQGIKLANPDLTVISFGGDGDSLGEGLEHTLFAAKRNMDITLILHNNGTYGLTTGQFSPLSNPGFKGLSTPSGSLERPFAALPLLAEAGATFLARGYTANPDHLANLITQAVRHKGFSFLEVMQPCVSYNNNYSTLNTTVKLLETIPQNLQQAMELARSAEHVYLGVFASIDQPTYNDSLLQGANPLTDSPTRSERLARLREIE